MEYIHTRKEEIKSIHEIYNGDNPKILELFNDIPEINRLENISEVSGINMTKFWGGLNQSTILDHCIGVALILEKYTNEDKQIIAGLLHGLNTPAFNEASKHMNEKLNEKSIYDFIVGSDKLFEYFLNNNIDIQDVCDYSKYPLAKSNGVKLDADSIEKILRTSYLLGNITLKELKEIYNDIIITKNEENVFEFAFDDYNMAEKFCKLSIEVARKYRSYESKISMKIVATLLELMLKRKEINCEDLYKYADKAIYEIGINSSDRRISEGWKKLKEIDKLYTKFNPVDDKFCVKVNVEARYIDPLVKLKGGYVRISRVSLELKEEINQFLNSDTDLYMYADFII